MGEASLSQQDDTGAVGSSTFTQTWSPNAAKAFDVATLPVAKAHKAWERRPQAPRSTAAKYKKVWKTYGLRSTPERDHDSSEADSETYRARAIKRMCVNGDTAPTLAVVTQKARKNYAGTKFDRRKSGITRKTRVPSHDLPNGRLLDGPGESIQLSGSAVDGDDIDQAVRGGNQTSLKRAQDRPRRRKSLGRHSLGANRSARRSFGGTMFGSIAEEPVRETVEVLGLSPRKKPPTNAFAEDERDPKKAPQDEEASTSQATETENPEALPELPDSSDPPPQESGDGNAAQAEQSPSKGPATSNAIHEDLEEIQDGDQQDEGRQEVSDVVDAVMPEEQILLADADEAKTEMNEDDITARWADETTTHLELDTALLKDFLSRTAAAKATRLETGQRLSLPRRASLQNRRDSDAVRMALASPRKPLDEKDPNSPAASPSKLMDLPGVKGLAAQLDAITGGPLGSRLIEGGADDDDDTTLSGVGSRRSARQRSRLPGVSNEQRIPNKISVKRTDGSDPVVVKKTEAQELSVLTRSNTRRNKGSSLARLARLKKLKFEGMAEHWTEGKVKEMAAMNAREDDATGMPPSPEDQDQEPSWKIPAPGEKGVRWRDKEHLLSFLGSTTTFDGANDASVEEGTSKLPPPPALNALSVSALGAQVDLDSPRKKGNPARARRLRGLGAGNGTPGKALLASASLLPDEVVEEKEKSKLAAPKERRSRIAAPKNLKLTTRSDDVAAPSMLKAPEVNVPKSLSMSAVTSLPVAESKEAIEARERRLASPRKIPQFSAGAPASSGGTRRRRM